MTENIVLVEFDDDGRPFQVTTHEPGSKGFDYYDFDWSKRYRTLYYHLSGGGPMTALNSPRASRYWLAPGFPYPPHAWRKNRLKRLPRRYPLARLFSDNCEDHPVYCTICQDCLPGDETDHPCDHVWWCHLCNDWSTPTERCGHASDADPDETKGEDLAPDCGTEGGIYANSRE
jgi:hypothetical protein